jgi:AcrR family transcriptional regulator
MVIVCKEAFMLNTKDKILIASYNLFCKHGEHFSLSQVAESIGIKKQSIYNYYEKKEYLIKDLIKIELNKFFIEINEVVNGTINLSIKEQLKALGSASIFCAMSNRRVYFRKYLSLAILRDDMKDIMLLVDNYKNNFENKFVELIQEGIKREELKKVNVNFIARYYITMIRGLLDGLKVTIDDQSNIEFFNQFYEDFWKRIAK